MKAELVGDNLVITIPFNKDGVDSSTGKTTMHASSKGAKEVGIDVKGKGLVVSVNAYTSKK